LDKELYNNLKFLKKYEGDASDLSLTFSVTDASGIEIPLVKDGMNINVTNANKIKYIYTMSTYKLSTEIKDQCQYFMNGLTTFISTEWLKIFNE